MTEGNLVELIKALVKVQAKLEPAVKDSLNPHFNSKYADMASCIMAARDLMAANGLCVTHLVAAETQPDGSVRSFLDSYLMHESGQYMKARALLNPVKNDAQGMGATITYYKRFNFSALLNLATDDDDGNVASGSAPIKASAPAPRENPWKPVAPPVTLKNPNEAQITRLWAIKKDKGWTGDDVKAFIKMRYNLDTTKALTITQYNELCEIVLAYAPAEAIEIHQEEVQSKEKVPF